MGMVASGVSVSAKTLCREDDQLDSLATGASYYAQEKAAIDFAPVWFKHRGSLEIRGDFVCDVETLEGDVSRVGKYTGSPHSCPSLDNVLFYQREGESWFIQSVLLRRAAETSAPPMQT